MISSGYLIHDAMLYIGSIFQLCVVMKKKSPDHVSLSALASRNSKNQSCA